MANSEHLKILRKGLIAWERWRMENPKIIPDLSGAKLNHRNLEGFNFRKTNLSNAEFKYSKLFDSTFSESNLSNVSFSCADLFGVSLDGANLSHAHFISTDLSYASLTAANLKDTELTAALFFQTNLNGANFSGARMEYVHFSATDLSEVEGLDSVRHEAPSNIGIDTLYMSRGKIPEKFLRDAGVPEGLISYLPSLIGAMQPFQWYSCFISYSSKNEEFAQRLHARMRQAGLRVWFAPEDMKGGRYSDEQIDQAIQLHDRLLLVLSEDSIQSKWVEREIRKTRKVERAEKRRKLFPITLTDYATLKKWECLDSDTGEDLAEEIRKYHIPDFSNWKNHDAFERAFARLEKDLRTSIGK